MSSMVVEVPEELLGGIKTGGPVGYLNAAVIAASFLALYSRIPTGSDMIRTWLQQMNNNQKIFKRTLHMN